MTTQDGLARLFYGVGLALMIGWILVIGRTIFLPIFMSIIVAYVVLGLAELIGRVPGFEGIPASLRYAFAIVVSLGLMALIVWLIVQNATQVSTLVPVYQDQLLALVQRGAVAVGLDDEPSWQSLRRDLVGHMNLHRVVLGSVVSVASIIGTFAVILIYAAFILSEQKSFSNKIARLSDQPAKVTQIRELIRDVNRRIGTYLVIKSLINIALGVASYVIMLVHGIEFAGFWAILIGLLNYIPYFGGIVGVALPCFLVLLEHGEIWPVIAFILIMSIPQVALGNFIEPRLMGNSLNVSPFVILVSLAVWTSLWGIVGAILAVPIMAILVIILSEIDATRPIAVLLSKDGSLN
ncbi:AI-2E family transporter [Paracoccus sp. CPCC 101403]|uniref:AI-2E family transporter n=1 Tax=Paracoccus broussonetiae TaxID=3075834 RepID=A0ABU3EJP3_9RHOB|nr:AI-2E family transporter [Paracoccus sp. CPCC 101403]MDT1064472.1 AI-2E family transporter [Paracoccus sp. CPCC 101403]